MLSLSNISKDTAFLLQGVTNCGFQKLLPGSLDLSKESDTCWRLRKRRKCPVFLVRERTKNYRRGAGACSPGNFF